MAEITNHYAEGSCTFQAGSSQNGDVHITGGTFHQGAPQEGLTPTPAQENKPQVVTNSPMCLTKQHGATIDFIRLMNALYECGRVQRKDGGKLTKKEYFTLLGQLFNVDLSNYDKHLSNSMATGASDKKQTVIFEELKKKHQEIFDSK